MVWGRGGKRGMLSEEGRLWTRAPRPSKGRRCDAASRVVVVWRGWVRGKFGVPGRNKAACRAEVEL